MTVSTPTILVVDDDDALAEMIGIVLAQEGYNAQFCANGARAFEVFMRYSPDLVLLDLMLPGKNGIEVCEQIRASSNVPIIMLTAKSDTEDVVKGLEAGADDYIAKPFKHIELLARIRTRLRSVGCAGAPPRSGTVPSGAAGDRVGLQRRERLFGERACAASAR